MAGQSADEYKLKVRIKRHFHQQIPFHHLKFSIKCFAPLSITCALVFAALSWSTWQGKSRQGKKRQGEVRQGKARQGKSKLGNTRPDASLYQIVYVLYVKQPTLLARRGKVR